MGSTVSNKQAKKPFFFVRVTVFLNFRTHSTPTIMNNILCFTICCLLVATEAQLQRYRNSGKGRQLVPPNRQEDINLPFRTVDENSILLDARIEDVAENEIDVEEEEGSWIQYLAMEHKVESPNV